MRFTYFLQGPTGYQTQLGCGARILRYGKGRGGEIWEKQGMDGLAKEKLQRQWVIFKDTWNLFSIKINLNLKGIINKCHDSKIKVCVFSKIAVL